MANNIYLNEILPLDKFKTKIKLVRHYDSRVKLNLNHGGFNDLVKYGLLDEYQQYQKKNILNCEYFVSFYGEENSKAVFYGIFKVNNKQQNAPLPSEKFNKFWSEMVISDSTFYYDLEELAEFKKYKNRIVIKWGEGSSTRSWHQWYNPKKQKELLEIRPINFIGEFPGYKMAILDYFDLKKMIENPDSNRSWFDELSRISAVYAILDKSSGNIYIGSAYGESGGLWGRWSTYAKDPTGGNKLLTELGKNNEQFSNNLQYSILEVLPKGTRKEDVISIEQLYKNKLGTKVFGLNSN